MDLSSTERETRNEWLSLYTVRSEYPPKWLQCCLAGSWLVPCKTAAVSAHILCTPYKHAPVYSVTIQSHIRRMHACLDVAYHLHFWPGSFTCYWETRAWYGHTPWWTGIVYMSKIYHMYPNQQYLSFFFNFGTTKTMFSQESFLSVQ